MVANSHARITSAQSIERVSRHFEHFVRVSQQATSRFSAQSNPIYLVCLFLVFVASQSTNAQDKPKFGFGKTWQASFPTVYQKAVADPRPVPAEGFIPSIDRYAAAGASQRASRSFHAAPFGRFQQDANQQLFERHASPGAPVPAQSVPHIDSQPQVIKPQPQTQMYSPGSGPLVPAAPIIPNLLQSQQHSQQAPPFVQPMNQPHGSDWWTSAVQKRIRRCEHVQLVMVENLLMRALKHSSQIRVFSELPLIRETAISEADSAFDWNSFLDGRWDDLDDPVGNTLTVGGNGDRYEDHQLSMNAGVRKRVRNGGNLELAQQFGWQDTNSQFFQPDPQGTARLTLSYTHPVMRGNGQVYNESMTVLACIDRDIAGEEFKRQLQSHLLEVVRAYWGLYLERSAFLQKDTSHRRAQQILTRLEGREHIDASQTQIVSARAEVARRYSDLRRAAMAIMNSEDRIRSLVNDPSLGDFKSVEMIPTDLPTSDAVPTTMDSALATAVRNRPEINQALKQIKAACVRVNMSRNELMPLLNLVTEAYVAGLEDQGRIDTAYGEQFSDGRPGYSIGLQFEVPLGNRSARSRHIRRHLELRQLKSQYQTTLETLKLEARVAVREVMTSFDEMDSRKTSLDASSAKTEYIRKRWELLPGENGAASFVLENLLDSQNQLATAEYGYLSAVMTYNLALINLKRATGTLLQHENVHISRTTQDRLPTTVLSKSPRMQPVHTPPQMQPPPIIHQPRNVVPENYGPPPASVPESMPQMQQSPVHPVSTSKPAPGAPRKRSSFWSNYGL